MFLYPIVESVRKEGLRNDGSTRSPSVREGYLIDVQSYVSWANHVPLHRSTLSLSTRHPLYPI